MSDPLVPLLLAQAAEPAPATGLWALFVQSFDIFTIVLLGGSVVAVAVIILCLVEVRRGRVLPQNTVERLGDLAKGGRWEDVRTTAQQSDSIVARIVLAAVEKKGAERAVIRDAAELAASEESARWFRKVDLLNVIGNLGPLVGLAGTVWGMILAFTSLGDSGGKAGAEVLSLGISKALFHTLLGLCLAIPCLLVYGVYRGLIDRLCTRGIVIAGDIVERVPSSDEPAR